MTIEHSLVPASGVHVPHRWKVSDIADLNTLTPAETEIDKIALVGDTYYRLKSTTPIVWVQVAYSKDSADALLAKKSDITHNHNLNDLSEKSYNSLTDKPNLDLKVDKEDGKGLVEDAKVASYDNHLVDNSNPHSVTAVQVGAYSTTQADTLLSAKENVSNKGVANGYAQLDGNAKLPLSVIPDSILGQLEYQGVYDFSGSLPTATQKGQYWVCQTAGNGYEVGDWAVYNGSSFDKVDNTDAVSSVAGRTGHVVLGIDDIAGLPTSLNSKEDASNKKTNIESNKTSDTFFPTIKAVYDWAKGLFVSKVPSTDNAVPRFNGTNGELQNSGVTIGDDGSITATRLHGVADNADKLNGRNANDVAVYGNTWKTYGDYVQFTQSVGDTNNNPNTEWHSTIKLNHNNPAGYFQQLAFPFWGENLRWRRLENGNDRGWRTIWHSANDGAGSGLDADKLDGMNTGYSGTNYIPYADNKGNVNVSGHIFSANIKTKSGSFYVGGEFNKFYPVVFVATTLTPYTIKVFRKDVHENGTWRGNISLELRGKPSNWGHTANWQKLIHCSYSYNTRFAGYTHNVYSSEVILWLEGGGNTYYYEVENVDSVSGNSDGAAKYGGNGAYFGIYDSIQSMIKVFTPDSGYSNAGNLLVGTATDNGVDKLQVNGGITIRPLSSATPINNGDVVFELTNDNTLKIKAKGSDGTVRSATLTLS